MYSARFGRLLLFAVLFMLTAQAALAQNQTDTVFTVDSIAVEGNRITKRNIIIRELSFKKGDTIHNWAYHRDQSRRQLINLFLFNEIHIDRAGSTVYIRIKERWYIWPKPMLDYADRNFNQWWLSKDPGRLIYGLNLEWYNLRGRNETMVLSFLAGYTRMASLVYRVPYFNRKQSWGFQFSAHASSNREVWYRTEYDKVQFFQDRDRNLIKRRNAELVFSHRKRIFNYHHFYTGYRYTAVEDTVYSEAVNNSYLMLGRSSQAELYGGYQYVFDRRDYKGFPLKGALLKFNTEISNYFVPASAAEPASNLKTATVKLAVSVYRPLLPRLFGSAHVTGRYHSNERPPYSRVQALGYGKDYIRGYELNVVDGSHFGLIKTELKYRLYNRKLTFMPRIRNYEVLPLSIYASAFWDGGYVYNKAELEKTSGSNTLPNSYLSGAGAGINMVMFYDYCFRLEYALNKNAFSRFYVSFVAPM